MFKSSLLAALGTVLLCVLLAPSGARAQATGILEVEANAQGAMVFIDGVLLGEAPILELVKAGRHTVRVERAGFAAFERNITVKADTSVQLKANLLRLAPALEVRIDVDNAKVYLDGQHIGTGRKIVVDPAEAGLHDLLVEHDAFGTWEGKVRLEAGAVTPVELKLRGSLGSVAIHSDPEGARVSFDGKDYGPTPAKIDPVKAGNHGLRLTAEGKADVFQQVVVEPGESKVVDVTMEEASGTLLVKPSVKTAQVFVNGVALGEGRQDLSGLAVGNYSVRVAAAGYVDFLKSVNVRAGGRTAVGARLKSFDYQKPSAGRLVGGPPPAATVVRKPGFWVAVGSGVGAAVGITLAAVLASRDAGSPGDEPGVPAPPTDLVFSLP